MRGYQLVSESFKALNYKGHVSVQSGGVASLLAIHVVMIGSCYMA